MHDHEKDPFTDKAAQWDARPLVRDLVIAAAGALTRDVLRKEDSCLDVGCGTGLLSELVAGYVQSVVGVDVSKAMVEKFEQKLQNPDFPKNVSCLVADLTSEDPDALKDKKFDCIFSHMAFHHLPNIPGMLEGMVKHLAKSGGKIVVFDYLKSASSHRFHPPGGGHGVVHHGGFSLAEIEDYLKAAGLKDVSAKVVYDFKKPAGDNPDELLDFHLFMAVGKSAE